MANIKQTAAQIDGKSALAFDQTTGQNALTDPGADRLLGWDDSENEVINFTLGTGLESSATSVQVDSSVAILTGRSGGQTLQGSTDASEDLTLESTAHATKGKIRALDRIDIEAAALASDGLWPLTFGSSAAGNGNRFGFQARGLTTDAFFFQINSDDWLLANNGYFDASAWVQPEGTAPSTMYFQASGGRGHWFYTSASGGISWVPHLAMAGNQDGRIYIGDDDPGTGSLPSWVHDGEGLAIEHEEASDKAWFQGRTETSAEDTVTWWGPFSIADDNAVRLDAAEIPDRGICHLIGGDVNQSTTFYYDLGHASQATTSAGLAGSTISLDGNAARTGTDGTDTNINIGATSSGLDIENRAGAAVNFSVYIWGHG